MSKRDDLQRFLNPVFRALGVYKTDLNTPNAKQRKAKDDAVYEAYLYAQVLKALDNGGIQASAEPKSAIFKFRRAPGKIHSTPASASYSRFTAPNGTEYDLLNDIHVESRNNKVTMEIDILVVPHDHAERCRRKKIPPSYRRVRMMLEAKYHKNGIKMNEAKLFVGTAKGILCSKCVDGLIADGSISDNASNYLTGSSPPLSPFPKVSPMAAHAQTVQDFVNSVENRLPPIL